MRHIVISISVCLVCICISAGISQKSHAQTSRNFLYMLPMAVAQTSSGNNAYTFGSVDFFHIMGHVTSTCRLDLRFHARLVRQEARRGKQFYYFPQGRSLLSSTDLFIIVIHHHNTLSFDVFNKCNNSACWTLLRR